MTKYAKTRGGRSAIQKPLNGSKLSAHHLASMGKFRGPCAFLVPSIFENANPVITHSAQPVGNSVSQFAAINLVETKA
jgi:hypothetical protein